MSQIVTRFAPSPTGYLHVGGARTALFNWLLAKNTGGQFLLRIEDTDLARSTEDATRQLIEDLRWLGLNWDNHELVYQSKRLPIYNKIIDGLIAEGKAYEAWETKEELDRLQEAAKRQKKPFRYVRAKYSAQQLQKFKDEGRSAVVRLAMPVQEYKFHDVGLNKDVTVSPFEVQDFVIRKTDGMPTYHFGVVVDDAEMGVTHVMRGLEHLLNTVNHIALQEALGYSRPVYAHLSTMLSPETGEKLSKRDRDAKIRKRTQDVMRSIKKSVEEMAAASGLAPERLKAWLDNDKSQLDLTEQPKLMAVLGMKESDLPEIMIHDFRKAGYTPEVLLNFLALQGWSPGGDLEQMTIQQMIEKFSLERLVSSNSKINREKLKSFSTDWFARATPQHTLAALRDYLHVHPESSLNGQTDDDLIHVLKMNAGFHVLGEVDEKSRFMFVEERALTYDPAAVDKVLAKNEKQGFSALKMVRDMLATTANWTHDALEGSVKAVCDATGLGLGKVAQPLRVAVSGSTVSPPIFDCLVLLGRERTMARIDRCLGLST